MKQTSILVALFLLGMHGLSGQPLHTSQLLAYDEQIDQILRQMTLEEKIDMLHAKHMFTSAGVPRLGIADMHYVDGPFGIREEMQPDGWAGLGWETDKATFFPTGSALAATWSPELAFQYGTAMGREARLRGKDMLLGPAINIQRIPTGGRTYEYLSEDPFLSSRLSVAYTRGVQDQGVAVCLKHYALNNQENNRGTVNVIIGERAMREIYLPPFQSAVVEADAFGVMAAYNKVNGWWCAENDVLLNQILRKEWGFAGMVISDWSGTHSTVDAINHGLNVEMPTKQYLGDALLDSVKAGIVSQDVINQRVREILRVRFAIQPVPDDKANQVVTSQPAQQKIAFDVAIKSIVLLKNDGILPLQLQDKPVIAVIGANATQIMATGGLGAGVKTLYEVTPLEGLKEKIGDRARIVYAPGYVPVVYHWGRRSPEVIAREEQEIATKSRQLAEDAVAAASQADLVLFMGGDNRAVETEGADRKDIKLPSGQDELFQKIAAVNSNIVTVIVSGAPNDLNVVNPASRALVWSWFNGSEGGNALADVLLGNGSPSGHLPFTLPLKLEDSPAYALGNYPQGEKSTDVFADLVSESGKEKSAGVPGTNDPNTAYYSEESLDGYRSFDTKGKPVMYPFGHGLTYTNFDYQSLATDHDSYRPGDVIHLQVRLQNTGPVAADEVVQVYVHRIDSQVEWPLKELKAFKRVPVNPGETQSVELEIPVKNLQYWDERKHSWAHDPGVVELQAGSSAGNILLKKTVTILD